MPSSQQPKVGLSLSGGGYRATAFHLGTLRKLYELGVLPKVDVISTISGGSISGACYALNKGSFSSFYTNLYEGLQHKSVIRRLLLSTIGLRFLGYFLLVVGAGYFLFNPYAWVFPILFAIWIIVLLKFQFALFPVSKEIEKIYDRFFYENVRLGQLPERPLLVIGSTNLQTARPFSFSRSWMQDSTYQYLDTPVEFIARDFPVARAVMASSCVPFAFTPVQIAPHFFKNKEDAKKYHPVLVDGGVYDNQGIHKVMQQGAYECKYVITSDAGCGSSGEMKFRNTFSLLMETVNVFMSRIKKQQMVRNVYDHASSLGKEISYFSLGWDMENLIPGFIKNMEKGQVSGTVIRAHQLPEEWVANPKKFEKEIKEYLETKLGYRNMKLPDMEIRKIARSVGTNLTALSKVKVDSLIAVAEALTEIQVKLYCPSLIN